MSKHWQIGWILALMLAFSACLSDDTGLLESGSLRAPAGFPELPFPPDNEPTPDRVALGRRLFFDPILSRDSTISCGSCHFQSHAFADTRALSLGIEDRPGFRNAPGLFNLAYHPYFFMDGGVPTLELQVLAPIDAHFEMDNSLFNLVEKLSNHPFYPDLFAKSYGTRSIPYALTRSIAAYERSLLSGSSPYDRYITGTDPTALNESEIRGMDLFFSEELKCAKCHSGFNFTNFSFENIGLPVSPLDSGRMRVTLDEGDRGKFKTPSLRNVALTAPYMHDGSMATLDGVIAHFESGGDGNPNQSPLIGSFQLTPGQKSDLIAFLNALTDLEFVSNPDHSNPHQAQ